VGVDNAWKQENLEARKMLVNRADSQRPVHAVLGNPNLTRLAAWDRYIVNL